MTLNQTKADALGRYATDTICELLQMAKDLADAGHSTGEIVAVLDVQRPSINAGADNLLRQVTITALLEGARNG